MLISVIDSGYSRLATPGSRQNKSMQSAPKTNITRLLIDWQQGDKAALDELLPLVYQELHKIAASYLKDERRDHTLQPTALIHEAYLRLI